MPRPFRNVGPFAVVPPAPRLEALFRSLFRREGLHVLDYGCGYGGWLEYFSRLAPDFRYKAVDIDEEARRHTCGLFPARCDETLSQFDIILAFGLFELITVKEQEDLLEHFKAQLAPGGVLLLQYNVYNLFSVRWLLLTLVSLGRPKQYHLQKKYFRTFLTIPEIDAMFLRHGYRIRACEVDRLSHFLPVKLDRLLSKMLRSRRFYSTLYYALERRH